MEKCPILSLFKLLGEKWVLCILYIIKQNPGISFNELKAEMEITAKTLTTKIKFLEENGLVEMKSGGFKHNYYLTDDAKQLGAKMKLLEPIAKKMMGGKK